MATDSPIDISNKVSFKAESDPNSDAIKDLLIGGMQSEFVSILGKENSYLRMVELSLQLFSQDNYKFVANNTVAVATSETNVENRNPSDYAIGKAPEPFNTSSTQHETHGNRVQYGIRRYSCKLCEKRFTQSGNLKRHMITHSGTKRYSCDQCDKLFTQLFNLNTHKKAIHEKLRPYACNICDKRFSRSDQVKKHMHAHTHAH